MLPTDTSISEMIDQSWCDFFVNLRESAHVEYHDRPDMLRTFSGLPHRFFNAIFRARLVADGASEAQTEDALAQVLDTLFQTGLPFTWWVGPLTRPTDLGRRLEAHGLALDDYEVGMAVDLQTLPEERETAPDGLSITRVADPAALEDYLSVFRVGFEMNDFMVVFFREAFLRGGLGPGAVMRHYLARQDGKPVGCSALLLYNGIAGIYNVATLPEVRRQGIARAMTLFPLYEALAAGYETVVLQASLMGFSVYERLGFKEYCRLYAYKYPPDAE